MPMVSYAQNAEDVRLRRVFNRDTGFYIDVGANDPTTNSVTKHFYDRGWRGVNCEPSQAFDRLRRARRRDVNLNVAVSDRGGTLALHEFLDETGFSTVEPTHARGVIGDGHAYRRRTVPARTLASVCEEHVRGDIDFLSVDVEGHECEVIAGGDWRRFRPRVVVVENNSPERWEPILFDAGYLAAAYDGINRFYVRAEDRHLIEVLGEPVSFKDDFIPYRYAEEIDRLRHELEDVVRRTATHGVGPVALAAGMAVARRLHDLSLRFPRVARAVVGRFRPVW